MTTPIEDLYTAARELTTLLPRLAAVIPEQDTTLESSIGSHRKHPAAPIPWNTAAAMLYYEIHGDARRYESLLTVKLFHHAKYRPGTDDHTTECITRLPILIAHGREKNLDRDNLDEPTRALESWPRRIRALLDEPLPGEERWAKAPGGIVCPHCDRPLHVPPGWNRAADLPELVCRHCRREDGTRYSWPAGEWIGLLQDTHISAATAAKEYGLTADQVYVWHHRHPFTDLRYDRNGRTLYPRQQIEDRLQARAGRIAS